MTTDPAGAAHAKPALLTREFLILALGTMLFFFAHGALNPIIPKFVVDELGGDDRSAGLVMGSFAVSALLLRTSFGRLGSRRGARFLMLIGAALGVVGMLCFLPVTSVPGAIVGRMLMGGAQAALMTGSTVLAIDLAPPERRGEAASYILVAFHLGMGLGPILGESLLADRNYDRLWLVLAAVMAVSFVVVTRLPHRPGDPDAPRMPLFHRAGLAPGLVSLFGIVGFVCFNTFVPLYGRTIGMGNVAPVFIVASISIAVIRLAASRLPDAIGPIRASLLAIGMSTAGAAVVVVWATPFGVYAGTAIMASGMALQMPALIPVVVEGIEPHERASAMATFTSFIDLSVALTGPVFGLVVSTTNYRTAFGMAGALGIPALVLVITRLAPSWESARARSPQPT